MEQGHPKPSVPEEADETCPTTNQQSSYHPLEVTSAQIIKPLTAGTLRSDAADAAAAGLQITSGVPVAKTANDRVLTVAGTSTTG